MFIVMFLGYFKFDIFRKKLSYPVGIQTFSEIRTPGADAHGVAGINFSSSERTICEWKTAE